MPPKRKGKKRARPTTNPEDNLDGDRLDEVTMTFQHALKKVESTLSISATKKSLKNLGVDSKTDEIKSFFARGEDADGDVVELDQALFVRLAASKILQQDQVHKAFELIDQDGKGVILVEDVQRIAEELGEDMSREELEEMLEFADRGGEGLLNLKDFTRIARKVNL